MNNLVEKNKIIVGSNHSGKVVAIEGDKCFIEITDGNVAVCYVSDVSNERVERIEDAVQIGDEMAVKIVEIEPLGTINVSKKAYLKEQEYHVSDNICSAKNSHDKINTVMCDSDDSFNRIIEEENVNIDIEPEGTLFKEFENQSDISKSIKMVEELTANQEIELGKSYTCKVISIMPFGCFVEIFPGKDALCHIANLSIERTEKVEDVVAIGDKLLVKVIKICSKTGKIGVSRKAVMMEELCNASSEIEMIKIDPSKISNLVGVGGKKINQITEETGVEVDIESDGTIFLKSPDQNMIFTAVDKIQKITSGHGLKVGDVFDSKVISIFNFGCFVELKPGIEALCHVSELDITRVDNVFDFTEIGDTLTVQITKISEYSGKIGVSRRALLPNVESDKILVIETMKINPKKIRTVIGAGGKQINKITSATSVSIDLERDGTIYLKSSDKCSIEQAKKMISDLCREVVIGEIFAGKVVSIMNFGCFVELLPGTDGMCLASDLSHEYFERIEDVVAVGDIIDVQVIRIDEEAGKINVSRKVLLNEPSNNTEELDNEPSNNTKELECEPSNNTEELDCEPSNNTEELECEPSINTGELDCVPSNNTEELECEPSNNTEGLECGLTNSAEELDDKPSNNKEEFDDKPSTNTEELDCDPSTNTEELDNEPSNNTKELDCEPSNNTKELDNEPSNNTEELECEPSNNTEELECEPSNNTGELDCEPSNNTKELDCEPSNNTEELDDKSSNYAEELVCEPEKTPSCISEIKVGKIYTGTVVSIMKYGCFVELIPGTDGMCHISELDVDRVEQVEDIVEIGDKIKVKVTEISENSGKISLSRVAVLREERCKKEPGTEIMKVNPEKLNDVSGIGGKKINDIISKTGVNVIVEKDGTIYLKSLNAEKISLAKNMIKELTRDFEVGMNFKGKVVEVGEYGAYIEISPGKIASCHITDLTTESVSSIDDVVAVGDELMVQIVKKDLRTGRIILSHIATLNNT